MTVINIRGTSGSGKTTIVKKIMDQYTAVESVFREGRKRPLYYICRKLRHKDLAVLGAYENDCGGCDTITETDETFKLVGDLSAAGHDVLFEGLLLSGLVTRFVMLNSLVPLKTVVLNTSLEDCLAAVNQRRLGKWERDPKGEPPAPVNPKNTVDKFRSVISSMKTLKEKGVSVFHGSRDECLEYVKNELFLTEDSFQQQISQR